MSTYKKMFRLIFDVIVFVLLIQTHTVNATPQSDGSLFFDLSLEQLSNLEVSVATKTAMSESEAPSIVSVITANEIRNMGARDLEDILRTVPGYEVRQDSQVMQVGVRGIYGAEGRNNKILFMIDGNNIGIPYSGDPFWYLRGIPIDHIHRIELIRGPGSALYGENAFVGVINIITKDGTSPSKVSFQTGSFGTYKTTAELAHSTEDYKLYVYADHYKTGGPDEYVDSDAAPTIFAKSSIAGLPPMSGTTNYDLEYYNIQTKINYKEFYFNAFLHKTLDHQRPIGFINVWGDEDDVKDYSFFAELGYEHPISDKGSLLTKLTYNFFQLDTLFEIYSEQVAEAFNLEYAPAPGYPPGDGIYGGPVCKNSKIKGELILDYNLRDDLNLVCGLQYEDQEQYDLYSNPANGNFNDFPVTVNGDSYAPFKSFGGQWFDIPEAQNWNRERHRKIGAAYAQSIFDIASYFDIKRISNLSLTLGVRYDDYNDIGSSTNPRAGIVFGPTENLYFKLLYGTAFRAPTFNELFTLVDPVARGNPDLDPETLTTVEFLVGYNFTEKIGATVTYFNTRLEDLIETRPDPDPAILRSYQNIGEIETNGIEAELRVTFSKNKYAYFNLTYQDVINTTCETITSTPSGFTYTQNEYFPGGTPSFMSNLGINYDPFEWMTANISFKYVGKRKRSDERTWNDSEILEYVDNRDQIDPQYLVNATLTLCDLSFAKGWEFQTSCYNALDEDYRDPDNSAQITNDIPRGGRSYLMKLSKTF